MKYGLNLKKHILISGASIYIALLTVTAYAGENTPPTADAGPDQEIIANSTVTLDGSNSGDGEGDLLRYHWSLVTVPLGSVATLSDPNTATPTFAPDMGGIYQVSLTVNDGNTDSATDNVTIVVFKRTANKRTKDGFPYWDPDGDQLASQEDGEQDLDLIYCD